MATGPTASGAAIPDVCRCLVLRTNPRGAKAECVFTDGTSILLSSILASFIHPGDDVRFPLTIEVPAAPTEIQVRNTKRITGRPEIFQADIGYAAQPARTSAETFSFWQRWSDPVWASPLFNYDATH